MTRSLTLWFALGVFVALIAGLFIVQPSIGQKPADDKGGPPPAQVGRYQIATSGSGAPGALMSLYMCDTETGKLWQYSPGNREWSPMPSPAPHSVTIPPEKK